MGYGGYRVSGALSGIDRVLLALKGQWIGVYHLGDL